MKDIEQIYKELNHSERYGCRFALYPYWLQEKYPELKLEDYVKLGRLSEKEFGEL